MRANVLVTLRTEDGHVTSEWHQRQLAQARRATIRLELAEQLTIKVEHWQA